MQFTAIGCLLYYTVNENLGLLTFHVGENIIDKTKGETITISSNEKGSMGIMLLISLSCASHDVLPRLCPLCDGDEVCAQK